MSQIQCDRCHEWVDGEVHENFSCGVYVTSGEGYWSRFANPGEDIVCDNCMWADPRYIALYGPRPPAAILP